MISCIFSKVVKVYASQFVEAVSVRHYLRACLHGGGGPQVGEVTHLAVVEK